jgi:hypothetical protein
MPSSRGERGEGRNLPFYFQKERKIPSGRQHINRN